MDPNRFSLETLEKLSTKRLLNFYRKIRTLVQDNEYYYECYGCYIEQRSIFTQDYLDSIKKILDSREHLNFKKST